MTYKQKILAGVVLVLGLTSTGCFRAYQLEQMGHEISMACPDAHFNRDVSLSLGGVSWGLIKSIACSTEKDDPDVQMIRFIDRVDVVVYKVDGLEREDAHSIGEIVKDALDDEWKLMVKSNDKGDMAWIHYREHDGQIRDMQVAAYDGDEFTLVRLSGHLDKLFNQALQDHQRFTNKVKHAAREGE
jgi:hypothetical protein